MGYRIVVLGGCDNFGARVARALTGEPHLQLVVAGWHVASASSFVRALGSPEAECEAAALDYTGPDFPARLHALRPNSSFTRPAGLAHPNRVDSTSRGFRRRVLGCAQRLDRWGTDVGGMLVRVIGLGTDGQRLKREWYLTAGSGHGPEIPCIPAIVIARKLARGEPIAPGARPCRALTTHGPYGILQHARRYPR